MRFGRQAAKTDNVETSLPTRKGIRGIMRSRVVNDMIDKVEGSFKILIVDDAAAKILNSCMRMHDIMEHGITLVEQLSQKRQPVKSGDAIYFISPTAPSIDRVIQDWANEGADMYKSASLFFTSSAPPSIVDRLAPSRLMDKLSHCVDLLLEFNATEPLAFHNDIGFDLAQYFGRSAAAEAHFTAANKLLTALKAAGDSPNIRYQNTELARGVALRLADLLEAEKMSAESKGGTIIIVDRSLDVVAPLLHEMTYMAMVEDLTPLTNNIFNMAPVKAGAPPKQIPIDNEDSLWCELRHEHIADVSKAASTKLDKLKADHPALANWDPKSSDVSLRAIGDAVRSLPQFQEKQMRIAVHTELASKVMNAFDLNQLQPIVKLEQRLVTGVDDNDQKVAAKDLQKDTLATLKEPRVSRFIKLRLALIYCATQGMDKMNDLINAGNLEGDRASFEALKLFDPLAKYKASRTRHNSESKYAETHHYVPFVKQVIESAMHNTLDTSDFPWVKAPANSGAISAAAANAGGGVGAGAKPGRFGGMLKGKAEAKPATAGGSGKKAVANLDLGHGDVIPLHTTNRVWLYVVGGISASERRSAYEVSRKEGQEVIVGGTSFTNPDNFATTLATLS
jgi:syntaxin-binding protein 1